MSMRLYPWACLLLIILIGCGEGAIEKVEDLFPGPPLRPRMHLHLRGVPDNLWGPDALTDTDGIHIEWDANTEADLAGYKIYRSTDSVVYQQIGEVIKTITFYEDTDVKLETRYYYRITAFDKEGNESTMSEPTSYTLMRKPILTQPPMQAILDAPPTFRWLGIGETGFYTLRVFVSTGDTQTPFREIWHYETIDFDQFEVVFNRDGTATEPLRPGQEYRWRVDFEARAMVASESTWRFFQLQNPSTSQQTGELTNQR